MPIPGRCAGLILIVVVCAGLGAGCQTVQMGSVSRRAKGYPNWWNCYEQGQAALAAGRAGSASDSFLMALGERPGAKYGYPRERWRARTYGMHVIENYFPHREAGVAFYELGEPGEALRYLEKSNSQEPSGRAKYYINLCRKQLLAGVSVPPPELILRRKGSEIWTPERSARVRGIARGEGRIAELDVWGKPRFIELALPEAEFDEVLSLREGTNVVVVTCADLKGQVASAEQIWVADWHPPFVAIQRVERAGKDWLVYGVCEDGQALSEVVVGGRTVLGAASGSGFGQRFVTFTERIADGGRFAVVARDRAGNQVEVFLSVSDLFRAWARRRISQWVQAGVADATTPAGNGDQAGCDQEPPEIRMSSAATRMTVFEPEFMLDADFIDAMGLASVRVNGEEQLTDRTRGALRFHSLSRIPVVQGTNRIVLLAADKAGHETRQEIEIVRKTPEYLDERYRLAVGIAPVTGLGDHVRAARLRRLMEQEILREPIRFALTERAENWPHVIREMILSASPVSEHRCALRVAEHVPVDLVALNTVLPSADGATVLTRILSSTSGEELCREDVYLAGEEADTAYQIGGLVLKLEQRFPILETRVDSISFRGVRLGSGEEDGVTRGSRFIVIEVTPPRDDLRSGHVLWLDDQPVEVRVTKTGEGVSVGQVVPRAAKKDIREGYRVYSR